MTSIVVQGSGAEPPVVSMAPAAPTVEAPVTGERLACGGCGGVQLSCGGCAADRHGCGCCGSGCCCCCGGQAAQGTLTNGLFGVAPMLAANGIIYKATATQFHQGVASGGGRRTFRYGAKIDQYLILDTAGLGLWQGGKLIIHGDSGIGENSIGDAALFAPVNTAFLTPKARESETAITHFQYEQALGGGWAATLGKINLIDLWAALYPEYGQGLDGFMNSSMMFPLSAVPTVPIVFNGAGVLKSGERGIESGFIVIDSRNTPTVSGINRLASDGVTLFGMYRFFTDLAGLPGSHLLGASYGTGTYTNFNPSGWIVLPDGTPVVPLLSPTEGSWMATYVGQQGVWADPQPPRTQSLAVRLFGVRRSRHESVRMDDGHFLGRDRNARQPAQ